eukprot:scaffold12721_cov19-Tisochrysis_lutea.AAC.2
MKEMGEEWTQAVLHTPRVKGKGKGYIAVPACGGSLAEAKRACLESNFTLLGKERMEETVQARKAVYREEINLEGCHPCSGLQCPFFR